MRVLKRKKGREEYFYLQHSFRKGSKVITKEKYLGKNIPKDIEGVKEELRQGFQRELNAKLEKIKRNFQAEWNKLPESAKEREKEEIAIAFTYNTNAIEGSTITLEEAREIIHDKMAPNKPLRDIKETEAHSRVFLNMLNKKEKLDEELLLRWHKEVFRETKSDIAGEYRDYLVRVGPYVAPDWQDIKGLMKGLVEHINKKKGNPFELAATAHYRFEKIHPFGDGNGRIGRLLMNHILWHSGYPMLIIEYKKRKSYYKALQKPEEGFVKYFTRRYLTAHRKRLS
ncbi:Fic family protein [Candidatus Woesearchaeota archaeon]|nr:Fic family protein [Candidatus Woesearchaeota archaeon]